MLPSGTVTFLFTDIEGSTRLWEQHSEPMTTAVARHDEIISSIIPEHSGHVIKQLGDGFHAVFAAAGDAVAATVEAQLRLSSEDWDLPEPLAVRMGLHSGEAQERGGDYYGSSVNRAARLMATAHGGQIVLSLATQELVRDDLPAEAELLDLGAHLLKDLTRPEEIFQVLHPGLRSEFPALRSLEGSPHNLPAQLTALIGREGELSEAERLVGEARLLTLAGPGGVGKTRLSLQVAADLLDRFAEGAWFVELAPLVDEGVIPKEVASALSIQEQADRPVMETLIAAMRDQMLLLTLDNCEHLIRGVAEFVGELLRACPDVKILATSRQPLGIAGEVVWQVPPLPVPDVGEADEIELSPSVRLFAERAAQATSGFALQPEDAPAVVEICRRLDGIPLALELAAAQARVLSPSEIAVRLDDRFALLGAARSSIPRHETLEAAISWSYELLADEERELMRNLSVFRGGFTMEAVEAVCASESWGPVGALPHISSLVDQSLVIADRLDGSTRYRMLETIREYGWVQLVAEQEEEETVARHMEFFIDVAEHNHRKVQSRDQLEALAVFDSEHDNLRVVLERAVDRGDYTAAFRMAGGLSFFWWLRAHFGECRRWYRQLFAEDPGVDPKLRARVLIGAGEFAFRTTDPEQAESWLSEAVELARSSGSKRLEGWALVNGATARVYRSGPDAEFGSLVNEAVAVFSQIGDQHGLGYASFIQALSSLTKLGSPDWSDEEQERSLAVVETLLPAGRQLGERNLLGHLLEVRANLAWYSGDRELASSLFDEALDAFVEIGNLGCLSHCLGSVAGFANEQDRPQDAMALWWATEALRDSVGVHANYAEREWYERQISPATQRVSADVQAEAEARGRSLTLPETLELAREVGRG
ncbi:MAG: adenylate/guanylate cyclase domain-containing protein [Acidimicrobiia bacterium]